MPEERVGIDQQRGDIHFGAHCGNTSKSVYTFSHGVGFDFQRSNIAAAKGNRQSFVPPLVIFQIAGFDGRPIYFNSIVYLGVQVKQ
jgi:hypothetical protein